MLRDASETVVVIDDNARFRFLSFWAFLNERARKRNSFFPLLPVTDGEQRMASNEHQAGGGGRLARMAEGGGGGDGRQAGGVAAMNPSEGKLWQRRRCGLLTYFCE